MRATIRFEMDINVHDEEAFRQAARERAIEDGLSDPEADGYLDPEEHSLEDCAVMLFDPGTSPDGADIVGSSAEGSSI